MCRWEQVRLKRAQEAHVQAFETWPQWVLIHALILLCLVRSCGSFSLEISEKYAGDAIAAERASGPVRSSNISRTTISLMRIPNSELRRWIVQLSQSRTSPERK